MANEDKHTLSGQWDNLVGANLSLISTVRIAIYIMVGLTAISIGTARWSQYETQKIVVAALAGKCK